MKKSRLRIPAFLLGGALLLGTALVPAGIAAQTVEEFYRDNDITLMVGAAPGGSADFFARGIAPFLTKYLPGNPTIVVQNKPGAGGLIVAAELQHTAPRDGTYIATLQRNNYVDPLLSDEKINFDAREVNSLGSVAKTKYVLFSYGPEPISIEDAKEREVILATTGAGSANATFPVLLNQFIGTRFRNIYGYSGAEEQMLALERGEADGRAVSLSTSRRATGGQWLEQGPLHYIILFAFERDPTIPDVPAVMELLEDPEHISIFRFMLAPQEFGRPFAAPPGVPEDRLAALRDALALAAADPEFAVILEQQGDEVDFITGEELQALANELMGTPPDRVKRIKELLALE